MSAKVFLQDRPAETYGEADSLLRAFVKTLNEREAPLDEHLYLTLLVDGFLVSGEPVSSHQYLKDAASLPELVERIDGHDERWKEEERANDQHVGYLHLKNVRVFHPTGQPVPRSLVWWRIKLSAVSGFTVGYLSEQVADTDA